jgi:hypothetical protein
MSAVVQGMAVQKTITLGAYRKVRELVVKGGEVVSFKPNLTDTGTEVGLDARMKHAVAGRVKMPCPPDWHFGYVMGPVEAYLDVNGWVETESAGLGFEDVPTGINLGKKGWAFRYDPRMMAYESEEAHGQAGGFMRADYGESPKDKSHEVLYRARNGDGWAKNDFFNGMTLRQLRDHVHAKANNPFPAPKPGMTEFFTGKKLYEL